MITKLEYYQLGGGGGGGWGGGGGPTSGCHGQMVKNIWSKLVDFDH